MKEKFYFSAITTLAIIFSSVNQSEAESNNKNLYGLVYGGGVFAPNLDFDTSESTLNSLELFQDNGFAVGAILGYKLTKNIHAEAEYSFQRNGINNLIGSTGTSFTSVPISGDITQHFIYSSLRYNFGPLSKKKIDPYILAGAGLSISEVTVSATALPGPASDSEVNFSFQLGTGLNIPITENAAISVGYRFRGTTVDEVEGLLSSHTGIAGIKFNF